MDKPKFDPNKPFQVLDKPKFDQTKGYTERQAEADSGMPMAESAMMGAAQGASAGFADELTGGAKALYDVGTTENEMQDLAKLYSTYRDIEREKYKKAEKANPASYTTGLVAGSVLPAVAMPGVGSGEAAAGLAARFSPAMGAALESGIGGRMAASALEMAPIGAIEGAGSSEQEGMGMLPDMAQGAAIAGAGGAAISGVASGLGSAKRGVENLGKMGSGIVEDAPFLRQLKASYEEGKAGTNIAKDVGRGEGFLNRPTEATQSLMDKITQTDDMLGQRVGNAVKEAQDANRMFDIGPELESMSSALDDNLMKNPAFLGDPDAANLLSKVKAKQLTPEELLSVRDKTDEMLGSLRGDNSTSANKTRKLLTDFRQGIVSTLKTDPKIKQAFEQFDEFRKMVPETLIGKGIDPEISGVRFGRLKNPDLKLQQSIQSPIEEAGLSGYNSAKKRHLLNQLKENISGLSETNPIVAENFGDVKELGKGFQKSSDQAAIAQYIAGVNRQSGLNPVKEIGLGTLVSKGVPYSIANKVGLVVKSGENKVRTLTNAPKQKLSEIGTELGTVSGMENLSRMLSDALQVGDQGKVNAAIFSISQNPKAREAIFGKEEK